jgi:hypothetical protein
VDWEKDMTLPTSENKDWALAFANTRTTKRAVDLITLSAAMERLQKMLGGTEALAQKLGIHREMVREFLRVKELPDVIKKMVSHREIDSIDIVRSILKLKDKDQQIELAKYCKDLNSAEVRDIVKLATVGGIPLNDAISRIKSGRKGTTHLFFISLDDLQFIRLKELAKKAGLKETEYLENMVRILINTRAEDVK